MKKNLKKLKLLSLGLTVLFLSDVGSITPVYADGQIPPIAQSELFTDSNKGQMKPVDVATTSGPTSFMWADFGTHAVVMTVIMGKPTGDKFPITIIDAHIVSDQGTQHIEREIDKVAIAQLLVDGKKAKGTLMIPGSGF